MAEQFVVPVATVTYLAPSKRRRYLTQKAAYRAEAFARYFAKHQCECDDADRFTGYPGHTCEHHSDDGWPRVERVVSRYSRLMRRIDTMRRLEETEP